jgi:hypothetical protein
LDKPQSFSDLNPNQIIWWNIGALLNQADGSFV